MLQEVCWYVLLLELRTSDATALCFCVLHARLHAGTNHRQLQFTEHSTHLNKGLAHWIYFTFAAIHCYAAEDHQPQPLEVPDKEALLRGTAMHALLRRADLTDCTDETAVLRQADLLTEKGFLTAEERALVWPAPIAAFARSTLGKRTQCASKVLREYEFSVLLEADRLLENGPIGEQILLNGAIDLLLFEAEGLTIIDFKTDRVETGREEEKAKEHALQLALYAKAAEELFGLPVREKWVWFLRKGVGAKV